MLNVGGENIERIMWKPYQCDETRLFVSTDVAGIQLMMNLKENIATVEEVNISSLSQSYIFVLLSYKSSILVA